MHALNLDSGSDATSPVVISASVSFPVWASNITFDAAVQSQQASSNQSSSACCARPTGIPASNAPLILDASSDCSWVISPRTIFIHDLADDLFRVFFHGLAEDFFWGSYRVGAAGLSV